VQVRLGDHVDFSNGSGSRPGKSDGRFPMYGANGAIGYASEGNAAGPLIVVGRVGSHCGSVHYCDSDAWVTENALVCRANNREETRFWYYALRACRLNEYRAGSGQPLLNQRVLRDVAVRTPPADERRRIAELLGALDDKIAANRRVIDGAEALMVATVESLCDHVPLSSLAIRSNAAVGPDQFDEMVAHFSFSAFDDGAWPRLVESRSIMSGKFLLPVPCVLVSKLNPRIPRIWDVVGLPDDMAVASSEFVVLRPVGIGTSALWSALRQPGVSEMLRQQVAGTSGSRQRIRPGDLMEIPVPDVRRLPPERAGAVADLGALCHVRRRECARLSAFRDTMLPLLMSGTVRITDADG
jgi:type I restriction modification DNA specificity protein